MTSDLTGFICQLFRFELVQKCSLNLF